MDQELIIKALKSACGNKNFRFQVIIKDSQLHIYINRKLEQQPDYSFLTNIITQAIASLSFDSLEVIWLHSRKLGTIEPDWQTFVELATGIDSEDIDTIANAQNEQDSQNILEDDSSGDTGLLHSTGMFHSKPFKEEDINTFAARNIETEVISTNNSQSDRNSLAQYCFVSNKKLLTCEIIAPDKKIMRLVKFFHHLSDNNKQKILPALDNYFNLAKTTDIANFSIGVQKWFTQITDLNDDEKRQVSIWLSRYCFDSSATLAEFKAIVAKKAAIAAAKKSKRSNTEYSFTPAKSDSQATGSNDNQLGSFTLKKFKLPPIIKKIILPFAWTMATVVLIMLGIYTGNSDIQLTSPQISSLCMNTIGSPNYCRLAVNLAGVKMIKQSSPSIFPMTEATTIAANYGCQRYANVKAGISGNIDPRQTPVISSHGEQVFAHIYVVQAQQKRVNQPENIRVGCVYTVGQKERSPELLTADIIPQNWPTKHYQKSAVSKSNLAFGIYTNPINLGLYTIFAAIGIAIGSRLNLGIKVNHTQTIYLVAIILGMVQLIAGNISLLSLVASIIFPILAIIASSLLIKDFQINWNYGYFFVIAGIFTIVASQFLLYGLCISLINSLF